MTNKTQNLRAASIRHAVLSSILAIATLFSVVQPVIGATNGAPVAAYVTVPSTAPVYTSPKTALAQPAPLKETDASDVKKPAVSATVADQPVNVNRKAPFRLLPQIQANAPLSTTCTTITITTNVTDTVGQPAISGIGNRVSFWSIGDLAKDGSGVNPDGNVEVFLADLSGGVNKVKITQVTSSTGSILGGFNLWPSVNGDGTRVAFASDRNLSGGNLDGNFEIFVADASSSGAPTVTQVTTTTVGVNTTPSMSSDSNHVAFVSNNDLIPGGNPNKSTEIYLASLTGTTVLSYTQLTFTGLDIVNDEPTINQDGTRVAYIARTVETATVLLLGTGSATPTTIGTSSLAVDNRPAISQDGKTVVFVSDYDLVPGKNPSGTAQAFLYVDGQGLTQLSAQGTDNRRCAPSINGNGLRIACVSQDSKIIIYNVKAGNQQQLFYDGIIYSDPQINSDGQNISYIKDGSLYVATCAVAHLVISKTVTPATTIPGQNIIYTIVVTNYGPGPAHNVVVSDVLPNGIALARLFTPIQVDNNITTFVGLKVGVAYTGSLHLDGTKNAAQLPDNNQFAGTWANSLSGNSLLWHLDTDALDASGNGHIGTCSGCVMPGANTVLNGHLMNGVTFIGSSVSQSYLSTPNSNSIGINPDYNDDFTVMAWVKPALSQADTRNIDNDIIAKWASGPGYPYAIRIYNQNSGSANQGKVIAIRYDGTATGVPSIVSSTRLDDGAFHHIVFIRRAGVLYLYVDGSQQGSGVTDTTGTHPDCYQWVFIGFWQLQFICYTSNTSPLFIGSRDGINNNFDGSVDELAIFTRGLTDPEVANIYAVQSAAMRFEGTYESRQIDASRPVIWNSLNWQLDKPLVNGELRNDGIINMAGNRFLFHFNEPAGSTTFSDSSVNSFSGVPTFNSPLAGVPGRFNNGADFSGSSRSLTVKNGTSFVPGDLFLSGNRMWTFETWAKLSDATTYQNLFGVFEQNFSCPFYCSNRQSGFYLSVANNQLNPQIWTNAFNGYYYDSFFYSPSGGSIPNGQWTHLAATYDGSVLKGYVNGKLVASATTLGDMNNSSHNVFVIGASPQDNGSNGTRGTLDELALYSRAMTADEIFAHYQDRVSKLRFQVRTCVTPTSCTTYADASGNPNGTINTPASDGVVSITVPLATTPNPIFQYRATFDAAELVSTPKVLTVTVGPVHGAATSTSGQCDITAPPVCKLGDIGSGMTATVDIIGTVNQSVASGNVFNVANVGSDSDDLDPTTHVATATLFVQRNVILGINKSVTPTSESKGQVVTYTLIVTNEGTSTATNVSISDTLPPGSWTSSSNDATCQRNGQLLECVVSQLAGTTSVSVTVAGIPTSNATGSVLNVASVTSTETLVPTTSQVLLNVPISVDIGVSQTQSANPAIAGSVLTYTIFVTNSAQSQANSVTFSNTLDLKTIFKSASPGCSALSGVVACSLGNLTPSEVVQRQVVVTVTSSATGILNNVVLLATAGLVQNPQSTFSVLTDTIGTKSDLAISQSTPLASNTAQAGSAYRYDLIVANNGPSDAINIVITDVLPSALTLVGFVTPQPAGFTALQQGQTLVWTTSTLSAGVTADIAFTVTSINTNPPPTVTTMVTVTSDTFDPDLTNNTNSLDVIVSANKMNGITIVGPGTCTINMGCVFTTTAINPNATLPITFTYSVADLGTFVQSVPAVTSSIVFTWTQGGAKAVNVSAVNPAGGSTNSTLAFVPLADLAISIQPQLAINAGDVIQYTLIFTNYGPTFATNPFITATLLTPNASYTIGGVVSFGTAGFVRVASSLTNTIIFSATDTGLMNIGQPYQIVFTATSPNRLPPLQLTASAVITSSAPDLTPTNNTYVDAIGVNKVALTGVALSVPVPTCAQSTACVFTATVSPVNATLPVTYTWSATNGNPTCSDCVLGNVTSSASKTWSVTGTQSITVSVIDILGDTRNSSSTLTIP